MKKIIAMLLLVAMMATLLVACGEEKFTCDLCGEKKSGKKYTEEFMGEKITYCSDCYNGLNEIANMDEDELADMLGDLDLG